MLVCAASVRRYWALWLTRKGGLPGEEAEVNWRVSRVERGGRHVNHRPNPVVLMTTGCLNAHLVRVTARKSAGRSGMNVRYYPGSRPGALALRMK